MIKPTLETLAGQTQSTFLYRLFEQDEFASPYHFHPEYELTAILKGEGNRFVGNNMSPYKKGDLVLIGGNVPHCWKTTLREGEINARSVVIQFDRAFLGAHFFENQAAWKVIQLLDKSLHGIHFAGDEGTGIINLMLSMAKVDEPFKRLIILLQILDKLTAATACELLNTEAVIYHSPAIEHHRLNAIQGFIIDNFRDKITLNQAAEVARMTPNAFCKFYKKMTGKTLMEAVSNYRLHYAMQQLISTHKNATEVSLDSGFSDVAFFHKLFKQYTGRSPLIYRKEHLDSLGGRG